jgi:hypothetical protein
MSLDRGRPEVTGKVSKRRDRPEADMASSGSETVTECTVGISRISNLAPYSVSSLLKSAGGSRMKASRKRLKVPLVKTKSARSRSEAVPKLFEDPLVQLGWWMRCIYYLKLLRCERQ